MVTPFISDISAKEIPQFQELRGNLTRIASPAGITYLKKSSVKSSVYLGSKYHAVDINGIPWVKKTELKKITAGEKRLKKKLAPVETGAANAFNSLNETAQISQNLSTEESQLQTVSPELSTQKRLYRVKKSLVRNRLLAYTNTKKGSKCLYFFTVTFPVGMPENMGYRCLNTWFTSLRKQRLLHEYLWVAERQPQTGTIHFHIAVPHYMRVWHVNGIMRKILLGYAIRKEIPFPPEKFGKGRYNGVDIAGTRALGGQKGPKIPTNFAHKKKSGSLANYLTKYVTKNNETFEHLAWHNSRGFSQLFFSVALSREQMQASGLWKKLYWEKKFEHPNGLFVFVPWFGNAPPVFWQALNEVNDYFQNGETKHTAAMPMGQTCYHNVIKSHNDMWNKTDSFKMPVGKAEIEIANLEIQMEKAFLRYCGQCRYTKEFCSTVRMMVLQRIDYMGMVTEFGSLLQLLEKEEYDPGFFYTYYLYLYWVVDLLNQIPNT